MTLSTDKKDDTGSKKK